MVLLGRQVTLLCVLVVGLMGWKALQAQVSETRHLALMGSSFDITVVGQNKQSCNHSIDLAVAEIRRIEKLISSWDRQSETSALNRQAGKAAVEVSPELYTLIERSLSISRITDGAFDISYAAMDKIWKFDGSVAQMPDPARIQNSVKRVGYQNIKLNKPAQTVFLKHKGMKIGFGAIGKGYAADRAKALLQQHQVQAGIINASGDLTAWGKRPNGKPWKIAITNPLNKHKVFATLPVRNQAIVTSGNYEKYLILNGERYTHIIDPRTGYPSKGLVSVTILAPKAELADALATSVFVMGKEAGIDRINQLPNIECILVDDTGKIWTSQNINLKNLTSL